MEACALSDHVWLPLEPEKMTGAYIVVQDGQEVRIPLAEANRPTHQCEYCGIVGVPRL
jgi:hypothetical protein